MIPLHRPPFGIGAVIAAAFAGDGRAGVRNVEAAHAAATGCAHAVWLPSARAGIGWALRARVNEATTVIGPAFTCAVVHEAMVRSRGKFFVVDSSSGDFLMDAPALAAAQTGNHATVLCEVYGHTYDLAQRSPGAVVRVVDMAMSLPHPGLGRRLQANDFAVISFGSGKSMYAGWGGMGFTHDAALAEAVRQLRDARVGAVDWNLRLRRTAVIAARTLAQYPSTYALAMKLRGARLPGEPAAAVQGIPAGWSDDRGLAGEWRLPATPVERALALKNLRHVNADDTTRRKLAERYARNLATAKNLTRPPASDTALSHYTVRLDARIRGRVKERMYRAGINTVTLWGFLAHLDRERFPNAFRLSAEVLNLPLSPWMSVSDVDDVCEKLLRCVDELHG